MTARIPVGYSKEDLACPSRNDIRKTTPLVRLIPILVAAVCAGCASQGISPALDTSRAAPTDSVSVQTSPAPAHGAGMRVYKDLQTGEITTPPDSATAPAVRALNRSHEGLVAVPNTAVPGGGVKLDLQGRLRSHFIATKDADGKVSVRCVPESELPKP